MNTKPKPFTGNDKIVFTRHFKEQAAAKGFSSQQVIAALKDPYKITEVRRYPGQWRFCGSGVAVVVDMDRSVSTAVTLYADGVVTPLRADQMNDPYALASRRLARA